MSPEPEAAIVGGTTTAAVPRPELRTVLSIPRLGLLGAYWLGVTAMWIGLGSLLAGRLQYGNLVAPGTEGASLLQMTAGRTILAILVQPAVGSISDHTTSRWGRRLPYIVAGSLADLVFLVGIASGQTVLAIGAFYLALAVSSNVAQGPFHGYIPDLVPHDQVGLASGFVGLMIILGNVAGFVVGSIGIATGAYAAATIALGLLELVTLGLLVLGVREPPAVARPRGGRSWLAIASSAWGRDLLHQPGFLGSSLRACSCSRAARFSSRSPPSTWLGRLVSAHPMPAGSCWRWSGSWLRAPSPRCCRPPACPIG